MLRNIMLLHIEYKNLLKIFKGSVGVVVGVCLEAFF